MNNNYNKQTKNPQAHTKKPTHENQKIDSKKLVYKILQ